MLSKFRKMIYDFKNVNHFSQMADAFDAFLNDAVDLHVQAVDHHRNAH
jgi:hypothetical protein